MKTLPVVVLATFVALLSCATTVFLMKSEFSTHNEFTSRWMPLVSEPPQQAPSAEPPVFAQLVVVDSTRVVLTVAEQQSLYNGLGDKLIDPVSAQVRKLVRSTEKALIVCGEVNSKNKFGGYVGFVPFYAGVFPTKAMVVIADADVASQMPRMGCAEQPVPAANFKPIKVEEFKFDERTRDASPGHITGRVTLANYDKFQEFIGRNPGKIVGISVSFENRKDATDLHTYAHDGTFHTSLDGYGNSQISASSGYRLDNGRYVFNGYFLINFGGMGQGSGFYSLELIDDKTIRFNRDVQLIELK